jgi:hypothetical protein
MTCGCLGIATLHADDADLPYCLNHRCEEIAPVQTPDLTGRVARCSQCGTEKPSAIDLPFFNCLGLKGPDGKDSFYCGCRGWD